MSLLRLTLCAAGFCLQAFGAAAQDLDAEDLLAKAERAVFHLTVTGELRSPGNPAGLEKDRFGKAFAIGPDLLLTANHVVGDWEEWALLSGQPEEVLRALRPINRSVSLTGQSIPAGTDIDVIVMPTFSPMIDATTLRVPSLGVRADEAFSLSLCDIRTGDVYTALLSTAEDPKLPGSVADLVAIPLTAESYDAKRFGGLYVFGVSVPPGFKSEPWGHDGSPIFDSQQNVVALVSAVTTLDNGVVKILATPVQALIPGTTHLLSQDPSGERTGSARPSCSMVNLVDRMARHVVWKIARQRVDGTLSSQIRFSFDDLGGSSDINRIKLEYAFLTPSEEGDRNLVRVEEAEFETSGEIDRIPRVTPSKAEFLDSVIFDIGQTLIQERVVDNDKLFVRLTITPYHGKTKGSPEPDIIVPWSELIGGRNVG
jgi:hypothetical protein